MFGMFKIERTIDKKRLLGYAYEDLGVNYFILLGLSISKMVYEEVYYFYDEEDRNQSPQVILLKRRSGNLQLMCRGETCDKDVIDDIKHVLTGLTFKELITSQQHVKKLGIEDLFTHKEDGALIAYAKKIKPMSPTKTKDFNIKNIGPDDVDAIEILYKKVFESFTPPKIMVDKLKDKRGRGVAIYENKDLVAVAQTDFETNDRAIIVGVATDPDHQHKGYGYGAMSALCKPLIAEGKALYLHYDNPIAGKLYKKMGFVIVSQIGHYKK
jgi:predicted GNAT family acetyltransferase